MTLDIIGRKAIKKPAF